jgi:glycosyltransferase involved in cell wall biosynthesis
VLLEGHNHLIGLIMKILFVTRSFPPAQSTRSNQNWKLATALANEGNMVFIITQLASIDLKVKNVKEKYIIPEHSNLRVYYVPGMRCLRSRKNFYLKIRSLLESEINVINPSSTWIKEGDSLASKIINSEHIDIVLSSSHPFESHLVGLQIKKKFNLPWVSFFSDPWPILPKEYQLKAQSKLFNKLKSIYFNKVINYCDAVATPTLYQSKYMVKAQGVNFLHKSYELPHIGERSLRANPIYNRWLVHTGSLWRGQASLSFLKALRKFSIHYKDCFKGLLLVGRVGKEFLSMAEKQLLNNYIKQIGQVSHEEAISIASGARLLLIIDWEMEESPILLSKLSDYAMTGRPILAITPKRSAVRDYLEKYGGGIAVTHDEDEIFEALKMFSAQCDSYSNLELINETPLGEQFTPEVIAQKYIEVFKKTITNSHTTGIC